MIVAPAILGMLGGGQLGRFFVSAAHELGYQVWVLDPDPASPAGQIADRHLISAYDDVHALQDLAKECAAITTEFENVPAKTLEYFARHTVVHPSAAAVSICQNRSAEKSFLLTHNFPHAPFVLVQNEFALQNLSADMFPGILKVAHFGYDGKGQARVATVQEAKEAFNSFKGEPCVLEKQLALDSELSVVLTRSQTGEIACFCAAENIHQNGILDISIAPARQHAQLRNEAQQLAKEVAQKLDYVGVLGVEFFVVGDRLFINEMAPRPHNSGHFTIDACVSNQFEQQVRALCGLPLGNPRHHSIAVMVNILGDAWFKEGEELEPDWPNLLNIPNLKLHLYGKARARAGRKMGHFTLIGNEIDSVLEAAQHARALLS